MRMKVRRTIEVNPKLSFSRVDGPGGEDPFVVFEVNADGTKAQMTLEEITELLPALEALVDRQPA